MLTEVVSLLSTAIPQNRIYGDVIIEPPLLPMMIAQLGETREKIRDVIRRAAKFAHVSSSTAVSDIVPFAVVLAEEFEKGRLAGVSVNDWKEYREAVEAARSAAGRKVIRVSVGQPFSLPRLGKELFKELMRYRLRYERGSFYVDEKTFIKGVNDVLARVGLAIEVVEAAETGLRDAPKECFICGVQVLCHECEFEGTCRGRETTYCLCERHCNRKEDYDKYVAKARQLLAAQGVPSRA
jgi:hypothetical protein